MTEDLILLPLSERARQYRRMATELMDQAEVASDPETRMSLLALASGWQVLAVQIEEMLASPPTRG